MAPFRPGLYAILDLGTLGSRDPRAAAEALLTGGCVALQLRAKGWTREAVRPLARALRPLCREAGVPYLVNDDVELAAEVAADGVHLGQEDGALARARAVLRPGQIIGRSTHDPTQARAAEQEGADYLGFGPVFPTRTKDNPEPAQGLTRLREACAAVALPVVAIGGIAPQHAADIARCGARAAAAISSILTAPDLAQATRDFNRLFRENCIDFE